MRSKNKAVLFALLSLILAANTWQGVVLCIGPHGHFALEPAGHTHCPDTSDAEPLSLCGSTVDHSHCCPCTDIPLPGSPGECRPAPRTAEADGAAVSSPLPMMATAEGGYAMAPALPLTRAACDISVSSTVLQV